MKLTITEAARAAGKSKGYLSRLVKEGKVSAGKGDGGRPVIDGSELLRVFPDADLSKRKETVAGNAKGNESNSLETELVAQLKAERDRLAGELERERQARDQERDRLLGMIETAQRQLADQRPKSGFWSRLFGGG